jgi:hypothetical protein
MRRYQALLVVCLAACGNTAEPDSDNGQPPFGVSGTYATVVTLGQNTCANVTVQNMPTVVSQAAGSNTFTMQHGGQTYTGTLAGDGTFTTQPLQLSLNGNQYTINITGRFAGSSLSADVRLDVIQAGGTPCFYLVHWEGTRS